jgi:hypothetical protein
MSTILECDVYKLKGERTWDESDATLIRPRLDWRRDYPLRQELVATVPSSRRLGEDQSLLTLKANRPAKRAGLFFDLTLLKRCCIINTTTLKSLCYVAARLKDLGCNRIGKHSHKEFSLPARSIV